MFGSLRRLNSGGLKVRKNVSCQSHPDCNNGASEVAKLCDKQFVICSADSQKPNHDYTRKKISMCSALDICFLWSVFETWSALFCRQKTANKESVTFAIIYIIFSEMQSKLSVIWQERLPTALSVPRQRHPGSPFSRSVVSPLLYKTPLALSSQPHYTRHKAQTT